MRARTRLPAAAAALMLACAPLAAQEGVSCRDDETVQACYARYRSVGGVPADDDAPSAETAEVATQVAERLQARPTGTDLSPEGPLTAIRDFLPRLAGALLMPTTGDDAQSLGFKANLPLNDGVLFTWPVTAQLAAVVHEAEPFARLIDSIPATLREAARERLRSGLEPYDDVSLTGSLNLENRRLGRGMRQHRSAIDALVGEVVDEDGLTRTDRDNLALAAFRAALDAQVEDGTGIAPARAEEAECGIGPAPRPRDAGEIRFDCFTPEARARIEAEIARAAATATRELGETERRVRAAGILRLAQLLNNQPQLNADWEYRTRADVVGPDEWTARARVELGFANMNGLRRHCGAEGLRASCLRRYVETPAVQRSLARADRVWMQADFTRRGAWEVRLPDDSVALSLGTATTIALSGGYGAYFGNVEDGERRDRLDVQGKYDFTGDDALRQNRLVATLFYTRRLTDQSSALLGLTWANRPEFVGEVDRSLSAHLGLTYKLHQPAENVAGSSDGGGGTTP